MNAPVSILLLGIGSIIAGLILGNSDLLILSLILNTMFTATAAILEAIEESKGK
jgi:hypothetical protein